MNRKKEKLSNPQSYNIKKLRLNWQKLLRRFGGKECLIDEYFVDLIKHYSNQGRAYHTLAHVDCFFMTFYYDFRLCPE